MSPHDLRAILDYCPDTGAVFWKQPRGRAKGSNAGFLHKNDGRVILGIGNKKYKAHRVAWALHYGEWPNKEVDHINGYPSDNRITNLRLATKSQNMANAKLRSDSGSGLKGVSWHQRRSVWRATITVNKKQKEIGAFDCPAAAHFAYLTEANKNFGQFTRAR